MTTGFFLGVIIGLIIFVAYLFFAATWQDFEESRLGTLHLGEKHKYSPPPEQEWEHREFDEYAKLHANDKWDGSKWVSR